MKKKIFYFFGLCFFITQSIYSQLVKYEFDIENKKIAIAGQNTDALVINNKIPGPTIEAHVGDTLEVTFNNKMNEKTTIHWHGILLPNDQDGVPYLNMQPISPNTSFTYQYNVIQHGTYWYHSHVGLQEQQGLYGALVFHPQKDKQMVTEKDYVIVLSDWTHKKPKQVLANLKKSGDYYALKKRSVLSWDQVFKYGKSAIQNRLNGALSRMGPMDISDIGYDAFLSNGKQEETLTAAPGTKVRIRLINAAASSYFNVEFAGGAMTVVAADGVDIKPLKVKRLRIAVAETYDVILSIDQNKAYELRATSEDGTGYSSTFIGTGKKVYAPDIPKPNLFLMNLNTHMKHKMFTKKHISKHNVIDYMKDYEQICALHDTSFAPHKPHREIRLNLTGNMDHYVWSFNNKTLRESDTIRIHKGEVVRLTLNNQTMMHHPIHLHGHFFRVINQHGSKSPLKHTVNVPAMNQVTIEFEAHAEKDWFFHCHNLYHMIAGMARVISYENTTEATKRTLFQLSYDDLYFYNDIALLSNMSRGIVKVSNTRNYIKCEYDYNYKKEYDIDLFYARRITRFFDIYVGGNFERHKKNIKSKKRGIFGIKYILPFLIESTFRIDTKGEVQLELGTTLQLTQRTSFDWYYNTEKEYYFNLSYEIDKKLLLTATYDSDFEWGCGIRCKF